ncbi:MAG: lipocalin family protein [Bdellovibrionales bacterium]|nr:lipocalin family protein [Oligoflexia bacterium]
MAKTCFSILLLLAALPACAFGPSRKLPDPSVVSTVDLQRYSGLWHEIAKTPNFFQRKCLRSTAEYKVLDSKSISVHNSCYREKGEITDIDGVATIRNLDAPTKLEVQFKIFLINPKGDYWITELDPDYQWVVVSGPGMKYNFLLAREFPMKEETKNQIFDRLKSKNYPVEDFIFDRAE